MTSQQLREFLEAKASEFNHPSFIELDPIQIPHRFSLKQDIEISGFLSATISWGNRKSIIKDTLKMMQFMEDSPYDFVKNASIKDLQQLTNQPIHRTFNREDFIFFIHALRRLYEKESSLESYFFLKDRETDFYHPLHRFRQAFFDGTVHRSGKHISSTYKNSSAKRLMMFLRWMIRKDNRGVDFGIWENISPACLSIPLDVHTGNISRQLGILTRKQNDWKAVKEMDAVLRKFNPADPAVYDFALFGLGATKSLEF